MEASVDLISALPEPILHHILSFLVPKDAIQASATSKRMNKVWTTLPYLDMGRDFFPNFGDGDDDDENDDKDNLEIQRKRVELYSFVERTLVSRKMQGLTIEKFRLRVDHMDAELSRYLNRWIHCLVECSIKELILEICCSLLPYGFPLTLLTATSLRALKLRRGKMPNEIKLLSLEKLHLEQISADDQVIGNTINACQTLEDLKLYFCHGFKKLHASGLKLKILEVNQFADGIDDFVVGAPNLEKLSYAGGGLPCRINIASNVGSNLKFLALFGATITTAWFSELIARLPVLQHLMLAELNLKAIEISSSSLKRLDISDLFDVNRHGVAEVKIDTPCLIYFSYSGRLSSISLNNLALREVDLNIYDVRGGITHQDDRTLCNELMRFLSIFDYSDVVRLRCSFLEKVIFRMEVGANLVGPPSNVKLFTLQGLSGKSVIEVVAGILVNFWISPNMDMLSAKYSECDESYPVNIPIKFTFRKLTGSEDKCSVCITLPLTCLRHSLRHQKYKLNGAAVHAEVDQCLRDYCTSNAELLNEIVAPCDSVELRNIWIN